MVRMGKGRASIIEAIAYERRVTALLGGVIIILFVALAIIGILSH